MLNNFIPVNRKLFKHEFWNEKRNYSRFEAWLDLIAIARYDDSEGRMLMGCHIVRWQRGQMVASIRYLGERWGWSRTKVVNYLKLLISQGMVKKEPAEATQQTIITICNYDTYNPINKSNTGNASQPEATNVPPQSPGNDETNKENKEQKSKERKIYRSFAHLTLFDDEFLKLTHLGFTESRINQILDEIQNYKNNKKYISLFLTAKKWLEKEPLAPATAAARYGIKNSQAASGKITGIANAFQQAMQYG